MAQGRKAIENKWVLKCQKGIKLLGNKGVSKAKQKVDRSINKYKTQLVIKGYTQ